MKNLFRLFIITYLITFCFSFAQTIKENWVPVSMEKDRAMYINVAGLSSFMGDEIFVWSLQEMNSPMTMEEVNGDIYKVRTYYHINKEINRYSILQIIFYDEKDNVLKNYSYERNSEIPEFKYNSPIIKNTEVAKILTKCLEFIDSAVEKRK